MTARPSTAGHLQALTAVLPEGFGHVLSIRDGRGFRRAADKLVTVDNASRAADRCAALAATGDVYVSCTATTSDALTDLVDAGPGKRGGKSDARALVAVWADLDIAGEGHKGDRPLPRSLAEVHGILERLPPASMVIATGGGVHAWWLLGEPLLIDADDRARAEALADGWVRTVAHEAHRLDKLAIDDGVGELGRVLRVCGTVNRKTSTPRPVELLDCGEWPAGGIHDGAPWRPGPLYGLDDLEGRLDPLTPEPKAPREARRAPSTGRPSTSSRGLGLGLLDAVKTASWATCWPPSWSYVGEENIGGEAVELWRRPDASSDYSAKCWPSGGARVWSDQVPGLPAGDYSKADVLAWRLGLNLSELARLIGREGRSLVRAA